MDKSEAGLQLVGYLKTQAQILDCLLAEMHREFSAEQVHRLRVVTRRIRDAKHYDLDSSGLRDDRQKALRKVRSRLTSRHCDQLLRELKKSGGKASV